MASSRPVSGGTAPDNRPYPASLDASEMVRNADNIRGIQTPPAVPSDSVSRETNFYISGGEKPAEAARTEQSAGNASPVVTIDVPPPSAAAVPDAPAPAAPRAAAPAKQRTAAPAASAKPAARPAPAAKPAASARPAAPAKTRSDYWVQTGAFTAKVRAEGVKETLASKGITSIIENRDLNGTTWYRVRVGPYTSESEANYWLALVKSIDGFADSQVRQTVSLR
jgi:DedD protein